MATDVDIDDDMSSFDKRTKKQIQDKNASRVDALKRYLAGEKNGLDDTIAKEYDERFYQRKRKASGKSNYVNPDGE